MSKSKNKMTKRQMVRKIHAHENSVWNGRRWSFNRLWSYYILRTKSEIEKLMNLEIFDE
jgi:hypothetical protein